MGARFFVFVVCSTGFGAEDVAGMAGILDVADYLELAEALNSREEDKTLLPTRNGRAISEFIPTKEIAGESSEKRVSG